MSNSGKQNHNKLGLLQRVKSSNFVLIFERAKEMRIKRQTIISILLILCALGAQAEDSIKVSATDLKALMQRVERLEQAQAHPNKLGVDAVSGASQQIPKDTIKPDTTKVKPQYFRQRRVRPGRAGGNPQGRNKCR